MNFQRLLGQELLELLGSVGLVDLLNLGLSHQNVLEAIINVDQRQASLSTSPRYTMPFLRTTTSPSADAADDREVAEVVMTRMGRCACGRWTFFGCPYAKDQVWNAARRWWVLTGLHHRHCDGFDARVKHRNGSGGLARA